MKTLPDSIDRVSMRAPEPSEKRIVCVLQVQDYPIVVVLEALVDERKLAARRKTTTRAAFLMMQAAVASWEKALKKSTDPEVAEIYAELCEMDDFNVGDVANQVGGYDSRIVPADLPEPWDLEYHLVREGFNAIEFHTFSASDEDRSWQHDDPLRQVG
jgi:hypothetical protein